MSGEGTYTLCGNWLSGPSYKAALMLTLCGIRFNYRAIDLAKGAHRIPEYRMINRYAQVPALQHRGVTIVQSNIILDYLAEQTGKFRGNDEQAHWQAKEWLAWEADRLSPGIFRCRFFARFAPDTDPAVIKHFHDAGAAGLKVLDRSLADSPWLVGLQPTIADIGCWPAVALMSEGGFAINDYANVKAWADRLAGLPGFQLPYELMPKEDVIA